uniref:Uncharacterized protein n=1 Tax=Cucumis melo TaxID=3656 RepID=A0A9I9CUZ9_CUCME
MENECRKESLSGSQENSRSSLTEIEGQKRKFKGSWPIQELCLVEVGDMKWFNW